MLFSASRNFLREGFGPARRNPSTSIRAPIYVRVLCHLRCLDHDLRGFGGASWVEIMSTNPARTLQLASEFFSLLSGLAAQGDSVSIGDLRGLLQKYNPSDERSAEKIASLLEQYGLFEKAADSDSSWEVPYVLGELLRHPPSTLPCNLRSMATNAVSSEITTPSSSTGRRRMPG